MRPSSRVVFAPRSRRTGYSTFPDFRPELLVEDAERLVFDAQTRAEAGLTSASTFDEAVAAAEQLAAPLDRFFTEVLVMAEEPEIRRNRLRLLYDVRDLIGGSLGDLSLIPR